MSGYRKRPVSNISSMTVYHPLRPMKPLPRRTRSRRRVNGKGHGRRPIPDHLPRKDVPHDVSPAERVCDCGREKSRIGEDVTEQLEYELQGCSCCDIFIRNSRVPAAKTV